MKNNHDRCCFIKNKSLKYEHFQMNKTNSFSNKILHYIHHCADSSSILYFHIYVLVPQDSLTVLSVFIISSNGNH